MVDFGCGKSYLTFALHHLLTELRGREVEIVGLDLKADVIEACSALAERSDARPALRARRDRGLRAGGERRPRRQPPRLRHRHRRGAGAGRALGGGRDPRRAVLPAGGLPADLVPRLAAPLLRHGLAKERLAALVTDALRAQLLELAGYRTQLVEFVELEHTPKNVLIRAVRGGRRAPRRARAYEELRDALGLEPTLERLLSAG